MTNSNKRMSLENKERLIAYTFILPWIIGFIFLFAKPMVSSLVYSFNKVSFNNSGIVLDFVGLDNYKNVFFSDPNFLKNLNDSFVILFYEVPVITIFSLIMAMILNQKFRSRLFFRVMFFLPVIIASGVVIQVMKNTGMNMSMNGADNDIMFSVSGLTGMLAESGLSQDIVKQLTTFINDIFQITWKSGIQIILYLGQLQTIPASFYEVSKIEGATVWETFWKVTFPIISPMTLLCLIYSLIDSFTYYGNPIIQMIDQNFITRIDYASALSWVYFAAISLFLLVVGGLTARKVVYMND